jgi:hypothetical protein
VGHPETGAGGATHSGDTVLLAVGAIALVGACAAMSQAVRRQRGLPTGDGPGHDEPAGEE